MTESVEQQLGSDSDAVNSKPQLPHIRFAVNETPYCFWDLDVHGKNLEFINKVDPKYFEHIADLHGGLLEGDEKQYAAAALRVAYSHGLETLFALLCAVVQAPDCVIGWFLKYRNGELFELVRKISDGRTIYSKLKCQRVTWQVIAELVLTNVKTGDAAKDKSIRNNFARLWRRFATDFLNTKQQFEYNSIKHGLRARMGGFYLAMGAEDIPGVPAPPERMHVMGSSEFGSSFFIPERLHDGRNFTVSHQSLNWSPENFDYALRLISLSISNVIGFLKILYGQPASETNFSWPSDDKVFEEPWLRYSGMTSMGWNSQITEQAITALSKEDILDVYSEGKDEKTD